MRPRPDPYPEAERDHMIMRLVIMGIDETNADLFYPSAGNPRETAELTGVAFGRNRLKAPFPAPPVDLDIVASPLWKVSLRALMRRTVPVFYQSQWVTAFNAGPGANPGATLRECMTWATAWVEANIP